MLACLRFEFGAEFLDKTYAGSQGKRICAAVATRAGLPSPHLLALWFGAYNARTPTVQTPTRLRDDIYAQRPAEISDEDHFSHTCRKAIENWAARQGYNLVYTARTARSIRVARKLCVFASLSTLPTKVKVTAGLRLSCKD